MNIENDNEYPKIYYDNGWIVEEYNTIYEVDDIDSYLAEQKKIKDHYAETEVE